MSKIDSIDLKVIKKNREALSVFDILSALKEGGWSFKRGNQVEFIPVGDDGLYDWQTADFYDDEQFYKLLKTKTRRCEIIAVIFYWRETETGIHLLFNPETSVVGFSLGPYLKQIQNTDLTDVNWYLMNLVKPFLEDETLYVESIDYSRF